MAARNPLVMINGKIQELPSSDTLNGVTGGSGNPVVATATGPSGEIASGGPPARRYWRVRGPSHSGSNLGLAELQLREVVGTPESPSGGTAICDSAYYPAANAFDGNTATAWASNNSTGWIGYDYGSGVTKTINEVAIIAQTGAYYDQAPGTVYVEWSSDGTTWTTEFTATPAAWSSGSTQVFTDPNAGSPYVLTEYYPTKLAALNDVSLGTPTDGQVLTYVASASKWEPQTPAGGAGYPGPAVIDWTDYNPLTAHRYWRLNITAAQSGGLVTITELYLLNTTGTTLTGTWTANDTSNGAASNVADGNAGTFWGTGGLPGIITLDLGSGSSAVVDQIQMTARTSYQSQCADVFKLQYSDDNTNWYDATAFTGVHNWASGQRKIFRARPYIVQFYMDYPNIQNGGTIITWTECEILNGTTDLALPATTDATYGSIMGTNDGNDATIAFDDSTSGYTGNAGVPSFCEYRFATEPTEITGVSVTARVSYGSQAPGAMKIRSSRDGITYQTVLQVPLQTNAWGSAEKRYFSLGQQTQFQKDRGKYFLATAANSTATTWAKVPIDYPDTQVPVSDNAGLWNSTNKRFIPKRAGWYLVNGRVQTTTSGEISVAVALNGSLKSELGSHVMSGYSAGGSCLVWCNGSTDYIELYAYTDTARAFTTTSGTNVQDTYLEIIGPMG